MNIGSTSIEHYKKARAIIWLLKKAVVTSPLPVTLIIQMNDRSCDAENRPTERLPVLSSSTIHGIHSKSNNLLIFLHKVLTSTFLNSYLRLESFDVACDLSKQHSYYYVIFVPPCVKSQQPDKTPVSGKSIYMYVCCTFQSEAMDNVVSCTFKLLLYD